MAKPLRVEYEAHSYRNHARSEMEEKAIKEAVYQEK